MWTNVNRQDTSNSCLAAYWFAECVSSQQVQCYKMFSLELQHQRHKQKTPYLLAVRTSLKLKITECDVTSNTACGMKEVHWPVLSTWSTRCFVCLKSPTGEQKPQGLTECWLCDVLTLYVKPAQMLNWSKNSQLWHGQCPAKLNNFYPDPSIFYGLKAFFFLNARYYSIQPWILQWKVKP